MKFTHKVEGFSELSKLLNELPRAVDNKILRDATVETLREVALPAIKAAAPRNNGKRSKASRTYGTTVSNIRVKRLRSRKKNDQGAYINTRDAFWSWMIERGTRYIQAKPWFTPTFTAKVREMERVLGKKIGQGIEREAEKSYRGGRK